MQVAGGYSALGNICEVQSGQCSRRARPRTGRSLGDTVSISNEALAAYHTAHQQHATVPYEAMPDSAAKFRQALEDAWNDGAPGEGASLLEKLRSALSSWKAQPRNGSASQEKMDGL